MIELFWLLIVTIIVVMIALVILEILTARAHDRLMTYIGVRIHRQQELLAILNRAQAIKEHDASEAGTVELKRCAAAKDGDCIHPLCPQERDNEPHTTGRHCPLDNREEEEYE